MVALVHDVLLTISVFSILGLEFNLSTVAAYLRLQVIQSMIQLFMIAFGKIFENIKLWNLQSY